MATANILGLSLTLTPIALTALRIAPLISTTASLTHAYMEWLTNSSFLVPAPVNSSLSRSLLGPEAPPKSSPSNLTSDAALEKAKDVVVPEWFTNFFNTGVISVVALNNLTLVSVSLNLGFKESIGGGRVFYQAGLAAAVAHFAFVPLVAPSVRALIGMAARRRVGEGEGTAEGENGAVEWVREWVGYHKIRMSTVDVFAWGCFACGTVVALSK
jgi:hypothetical protein